MNDETMDELAADEATVTSLTTYAAERDLDRAVTNGIPGLLEYVLTGNRRF